MLPLRCCSNQPFVPCLSLQHQMLNQALPFEEFQRPWQDNSLLIPERWPIKSRERKNSPKASIWTHRGKLLPPLLCYTDKSMAESSFPRPAAICLAMIRFPPGVATFLPPLVAPANYELFQQPTWTSIVSAFLEYLCAIQEMVSP
jgi:hypothetical protein